MNHIAIFLLVIFGSVQINTGIVINQGTLTYGRFNIYYGQSGDLHCGSMICPGAKQCIITQKSDQNEITKIITREKCFNDEDELIQSTESTEDTKTNQTNVNIRLVYGPDGQYTIRTKSDEEIQKDLEELQKRLENDRIELEERLAADAERRRVQMAELNERLENERIEREQRLAADAERRRVQMAELHERLENERIEREQRLAADAERRRVHMTELHERLESQRIEREQRFAADAERRMADAERRRVDGERRMADAIQLRNLGINQY